MTAKIKEVEDSKYGIVRSAEYRDEYKEIKAGDILLSDRFESHVVADRDSDSIWVWDTNYGMMKVPRRTFIRNWLERDKYFAVSLSEVQYIRAFERAKAMKKRLKKAAGNLVLAVSPAM